MSKKNKKETKGGVSRRKVALTLFSKLDSALKEYQPLIGEEKYVHRLKKAAKTLAEDVTDASKKLKERIEKRTKKKEENETPGSKMKKNKGKKIKIKQPLKEVSLPDQDDNEEDDD